MEKVHNIKRRTGRDYSRLLFLRVSLHLLYATFSVPSVAGSFVLWKFSTSCKYAPLSLSCESEEQLYKVRLQRTHRLRDYFAKNEYLVPYESVGPFSEISEVELIHEVTERQSSRERAFELSSPKRKTRSKSVNASKTTKKLLAEPKIDHEVQIVAFDKLPTFDEFLQCYKTWPSDYFRLSTKTTGSKTDIPTRFIARPEFHSTHTTFDIIRQEATPFNLVWLTDNVFMCSFHFSKTRRKGQLHDYGIVITPRQHPKTVQFRVYSLASLAPGPEWRRRPPPSELPIDFLWNMLKGTDLKSIALYWARSDFVPPVVKLVSIIPLPTARPQCQETPTHEELTDVVFRGELEAEEINSVLTYCGQRKLPVRYEFDQYSAGEHVNKVLRESPHLLHVHVPFSLLRIETEKGGAPFTENSHIESMSVEYSSRESILRGAVRNRGLKRLLIEVSWCYSSFFAVSDSFLLPGVLYGGACPLEEMIILFDCFRSIDDVAKILDGCVEPVRTNLRHFSVVTSDDDNSGEELPNGCIVPWFKEAMANKPLWDRTIFPALALNWWYGNYLRKQTRGGSDQQALVPWIVQAVNLGIVYRKTTFHTPHDISTSNASVLFALLRTATLQAD
jgi:hypothetical protein